jgi:hypothetical protein
MSYSCSDYTDAILETLASYKLIDAAELPDDDPETQAQISIDAIDNLVATNLQLLQSLRRWQRFGRDNGWNDENFHQADGTGWISEMDAAIRSAEALTAVDVLRPSLYKACRDLYEHCDNAIPYFGASHDETAPLALAVERALGI